MLLVAYVVLLTMHPFTDVKILSHVLFPFTSLPIHQSAINVAFNSTERVIK